MFPPAVATFSEPALTSTASWLPALLSRMVTPLNVTLPPLTSSAANAPFWSSVPPRMLIVPTDAVITGPGPCRIAPEVRSRVRLRSMVAPA